MAKTPTRREAERPSLDQYRDQLAIDRVDLDECLIKQPELYYHVAEGHVQAAAERDAVKLELEEALAEEDEKLRRQLADEEAKAAADEEDKPKKGRGRSPGGMTETAIKGKIAMLPKIQQLQRDFLDAKKEADRWYALKEGFTQRSYMMKELVNLMLSQLRDNAASSAGNSARADLADSNRQQAGQIRRQRRGQD